MNFSSLFKGPTTCFFREISRPLKRPINFMYILEILQSFLGTYIVDLLNILRALQGQLFFNNCLPKGPAR